MVINACRLLVDHIYPKGCRVYTGNVRLLINEGEEYRLPDVLVTCSEGDRASRDAKRDPVVLVEVLSPATALQDLTVKADSYRKIASLRAYLIVNPAQVWVRLYQRSTTTGEWLPNQALTDLQAGFLVETLSLSLPLADLYRFVF